VYEEVDEEKYNEIVQKRREKGRFVVDGGSFFSLVLSFRFFA
jgi:(2Fe-2S) ferredoxin